MIEFKEWDSEVLGVKCGYMTLPMSIKHDYDFLHARVPVSDWGKIRDFRCAGFRIVGIHQELSRNLEKTWFPPEDSPSRIPGRRSWSYATKRDAEEIGELAYGLFNHDRLHADPRIPQNVADRYKAEWGRNTCLGYADAALLIRDMWGTIGFVAVKEQWLYFIGVRKDWQRRGLGRTLIELACMEVKNRHNTIRTATQGGNVAALNMYTKAHFMFVQTSVDMHWIRNDNVFYGGG